MSDHMTLNHISSETLLGPVDAILNTGRDFLPGHGGRRTGTSGPVTSRSYGSEGYSMENYTSEPYTKLFMPRLHDSGHHIVNWSDNTRRNPDTQSKYSELAPPRKRPSLNRIRPVRAFTDKPQTLVGNTDQYTPFGNLHHSHVTYGSTDRFPTSTSMVGVGGDVPSTSGGWMNQSGLSSATSSSQANIPNTGVLASTAKKNFTASAMENASLGK